MEPSVSPPHSQLPLVTLSNLFFTILTLAYWGFKLFSLINPPKDPCIQFLPKTPPDVLWTLGSAADKMGEVGLAIVTEGFKTTSELCKI